MLIYLVLVLNEIYLASASPPYLTSSPPAVEVYKCNQMARDCSQCQGLIKPEYQCSWCTATNQCTLFSDSCQSRLVQVQIIRHHFYISV